MFIPTRRLLLRPSWPEDLAEFVALINDERVANTLVSVPLPDSVDAARAYIAAERDPLLPHFFIYLRRQDGLQLIGSAGFERVADSGEVELGYWIAGEHQGCGYASEAVEAVLAHAWMLGHRRILSLPFANNEVALRLLEHAGFVNTGERHSRVNYRTMREQDALVFEAVREDRVPSVGEVDSREVA